MAWEEAAVLITPTTKVRRAPSHLQLLMVLSNPLSNLPAFSPCSSGEGFLNHGTIAVLVQTVLRHGGL